MSIIIGQEVDKTLSLCPQTSDNTVNRDLQRFIVMSIFLLGSLMLVLGYIQYKLQRILNRKMAAHSYFKSYQIIDHGTDDISSVDWLLHYVPLVMINNFISKEFKETEIKLDKSQITPTSRRYSLKSGSSGIIRFVVNVDGDKATVVYAERIV